MDVIVGVVVILVILALCVGFGSAVSEVVRKLIS